MIATSTCFECNPGYHVSAGLCLIGDTPTGGIIDVSSLTEGEKIGIIVGVTVPVAIVIIVIIVVFVVKSKQDAA